MQQMSVLCMTKLNMNLILLKFKNTGIQFACIRTVLQNRQKLKPKRFKQLILKAEKSMIDSRYYLIQETKNNSRNQFLSFSSLDCFFFVSMGSSTRPGKIASSRAPASNLPKFKSNEREHIFLPSILSKINCRSYWVTCPSLSQPHIQCYSVL